MKSYSDAKAMAKAMRQALANAQIQISHSQALEIVARQFGFANWNILAARISADEAAISSDGAIAFEQAVPIVRIFDVAKAHEFYLGFLGFQVDWEHRFHPEAPLYTQVSRAICAFTCQNIRVMQLPAATWLSIWPAFAPSMRS